MALRKRRSRTDLDRIPVATIRDRCRGTGLYVARSIAGHPVNL
jgi:hypothetical protein